MSDLDPLSSPAFEPFAKPLRDPVVRSLAERTLVWARNHALLERSAQRKPEAFVVVASVYARRCAPPAPLERSWDLAARFLLLFFFLDDAPSDMVATFLAESSTWSVGPLTAGLAAWLADLDQTGAGSPALRARFTRSFHEYLEARTLEASAAPATFTLDEHWRARRATIGTEPYIDQWMISSALDVGAFRVEDFAEARARVTDLVLLANDLASVEKDRPGGDSPDDLNLVDAHARVHRCSREDAVEALVAHHGELVARCRDALATALAANEAPAARAYADLLRGIADGNLDALAALDFRYRGVEHVLARLARVG